MENHQVPGYFLIQNVKFVEKEKGPEGKKGLKAMVPNLDIENLSPFKKYSVDQEIALLSAVATIIYGDDSYASWQKLGYHDFETVKESSVGKVLLSLFGNTPENLLKNASRIFASFYTSIKFSYQDLTDHGVTVIIENDPYPKEYYKGVIRGVGDLLGYDGEITAEETAPKTHTYKLIWKNK